MDAKQATENYKKFQAHEKRFKEGMQLHEQNCDAPKDRDTPEWYGYMAAFEIKVIRTNWLKTSRRHFGVE